MVMVLMKRKMSHCGQKFALPEIVVGLQLAAWRRSCMCVFQGAEPLFCVAAPYPCPHPRYSL